MPFMPGRTTSIIAKSGRHSSSISSACSAEYAVRESYPLEVKINARVSAMLSSSSITRILRLPGMGGMCDLVFGRTVKNRPKPFMNTDIRETATKCAGPSRSSVSRLDAAKILLGYLQQLGQTTFICEVSQMDGLSFTPEAHDGFRHPSRA